MKKKLFTIIATTLCIAGCFISCSKNDDDIPPRKEEPEPEAKYNDLGFPAHKDGEPYDSYEGLVMAGYQGWFGAPGDGCSHNQSANTAWYHYRESEVFKPGVLQNSIDFWPDMEEYPKKYDTSFKYPDGATAQVFSSYDESSVMLHFKWMKDYGIDGVFMQRFVGEVVDNSQGKDHFNKVLSHAMKASNEYQRAICVMYDLGGFMSSASKGVSAVLADTQEILDKYNLTDRNAGQKYYLYQNGKPLIVLWGVGFNDNRPYSISDVTSLVDGLKAKGFSIMLGVPTYWREGRNDAVSDKSLISLIKSVDVIMPWFVGRYDKGGYAGFHSLISSDISWCKTNGVSYAPLCFPGSSDRNMHPNNGVNKRYGGEFFWDQLYYCINAGAKMIYVAMFDEIDEGTAIFKCLNESDVPDNTPNPDYWVLYENGNYSKRSSQKTGLSGNDWCTKASELGITFQGVEDGLPTDHYLWMTGAARSMLRGEIPLTSTLPKR